MPPDPTPVAPRSPSLPDNLTSLEDDSLDDATWTGVHGDGDFSGQTAAGVEILECAFERAQFVGADVDGIRVRDTVFRSCDLSGAVLDNAVLQRVEFVDCRMAGLGLAHARLDDVVFRRCRLDDANLRMISCTRVWFDESSLTGADFYEATIGAGALFDCDLRSATLTQADLRGARLHGSRLEGVVGTPQLGGAVIDSSQVVPLALWLASALGVVIDDDRGEHG